MGRLCAVPARRLEEKTRPVGLVKSARKALREVRMRAEELNLVPPGHEPSVQPVHLLAFDVVTPRPVLPSCGASAPATRPDGHPGDGEAGRVE